MQTASDACACSGVISRPDPTLPVDPFDVIEESVDTDATIHDPTFAVEGLGQPPPVPESDALLGMMVPGPDLGPNDLAILVPPKSWNARRVLVALGMGLATLAGILVALNAHNHLSAPDPADIPDPLAGIRVRVNATAGRIQDKKATPRPKVTRKTRPISRRQRARRHLARARRAYRKHRWARAHREAKRAARLDRRSLQARRLERRAAARLKRQKRAIARQLVKAHRALKRRHWRRARHQALAVLRVDPRNRRARAIKRRAEAQLRRKT